MTMSYSVSVVVAVLVVCTNAEVNWEALKNSIAASARQAYIADFEDVARQYAENLGRQYNRRVSWWDIHGRHEHLASRPEYKQYKIDVHVDRVNYGTVKRTVDRPGYVYTQWFHNSQNSQIIEGQMGKTIERASSFTWSIEEGLKLGLEVSVSAGVPEVFGASVSVSTELSFSATQSKTTSETETFTISNTIKVDPKTSVKAEWTITEREMEVAWEADVYIDGYIAIWFDEKYDGHWLWFHPVWNLSNEPFAQYGNGLRYRAKGTFTGVRGLESILKTYEYPLQTSLNNAYLNYAVPRNITIVERKAANPLLNVVHGE